MPNFDYTVWSGLFVQKGVPADIVRKLDADVRAVLARTGCRQEVRGLRSDPGDENMKEFVERIKRDTSANEAIVNKAHLQTDK